MPLSSGRLIDTSTTSPRRLPKTHCEITPPSAHITSMMTSPDSRNAYDIYLILRLDFIVASHNLGVAGRGAGLVTASANARSLGHDVTLIRSRWRRGRSTAALGGRGRGGAIVSLAWLSGTVDSTRKGFAADVVICDAAAVGAALSFRVGDHFVVVVPFGGADDDVPCVQQAGEVAKQAEEDIDQGVDGAETGFDPDCGVKRETLGIYSKGL